MHRFRGYAVVHVVEIAVFVHWAVAVWALAVGAYAGPGVVVVSGLSHNAIRTHARGANHVVHLLFLYFFLSFLLPLLSFSFSSSQLFL